MDNMNVYVDENSRRHYATSELSRGGQGIVLRTTDPEIVIKLELDPFTYEIIDGNNSASNRKYKNLRLLPIHASENVHITLPVATLKDNPGYIMRLLNDMLPFEKAFDLHGAEPVTNEWLDSISAYSPECAETFGKYIATGGARRRLNAYMKAATYLTKLHSHGLVYCDISLKNMFISSGLDSLNVWLIDADNINYQKMTLKSSFFTPPFGAPELWRGGGCTFYSDCYALAVSLFWDVTGNHPFKGSLTDELSEESDFADEGVEVAYSGDYPWIGDKTDSRNATDAQMIPYETIFDNKMLDLFQAMFSKAGREARETRPTMFQIADRLAHAVDERIKCPTCEMDHNYFDNDFCPWCNMRYTPVLTANTFYLTGGSKGERLWQFAENADEGARIAIPKRIVSGAATIDIDNTAFEVIIGVNGRHTIKNLGEFSSIKLMGGDELVGSHEVSDNSFSLIIKDSNNISKIVEFEVN